jgi:hypothetical protein
MPSRKYFKPQPKTVSIEARGSVQREEKWDGIMAGRKEEVNT